MKIKVYTANGLRRALARAILKAAIHCLRYAPDSDAATKHVWATYRFFLATFPVETDFATFSKMVASHVAEANQRFGTSGCVTC